MTFDAVSMML